MALEFQTVDVKFTQGLDTKTQQKLVIPGKWNLLSNCTLTKDGTPARRDGIAALVAGATGNGLATYNDQLLVVNGSAVSSISTGGVDQAKLVTGVIGNVGVGKEEIRRSTGMQDSVDVAIGGGYACYVWRELSIDAVQTGLRMSVVDEDTGTQLQANVLLRTGTSAFCPRVVATLDAFIIFYIDGTSLYGRVVQFTAPTVLGAETALVTSASLAAINFDAAVFFGQAAVAYGWADGVTSVRAIYVFNAAGVPTILFGPTNVYSQAAVPVATISAMAVRAFDASLVGIFVFNSGGAGGTWGATLNSSAFVVVTPETRIIPDPPPIAGNCSITATPDGGGRMQLFTDRRSNWSTASINIINSCIVTTTLVVFSGPNAVANSASFGGGATDPAGPKGPWIAGKAFTSGIHVYLPVWILENYVNLSTAASNPRTNNEQNTLFLLDCTGAAASGFGFAPVVAKALYGAVGVATVNGNPPRVSTPCSTPASGTGFALGLTERTLLSFVAGFNVSPSGVVRITFTPNYSAPPIRAQLGETTYFSGGSIASYAGVVVTEHGFPVFPEGIDVEVIVGGGAMTAGVHQVVVIAEWIDDAGQRHQSAPSLAVTVTTAANDRLRIRVPSLLLSQKVGVTLVPFITQAAGLIFNRAVSLSGSGAGTLNDTSLAFTTLADVDQPDTVYAGNELLYTQPNQAGTTLPNLAPAPANALAVIQNRLFFDKADQPGAWGFSQKYINNVGLQTNEQLGGTVPVSAGLIVGFEALDEKVIIFCARKLFIVYGTGPDAAGGFSNYSEPQEIPSDVGCSEARSILKMPMGLMFKSVKGWQLLSRDLAVRYIGEGVAAFDGNSVSSAALLEDRQECRFSCAAEVPTQLVYSYIAEGGQWSTAVYRANSGAAVTNVAIADALWWPTGGYYATVSLVHGTNRDTPGLFLDQPGTSPTALVIITTARTAWLRLSIINGFQRVRRMYLTGTTLDSSPVSTVAISVDFNDGYGLVELGAYSFSLAWSTAYPAFVTGSTVDLRHHMRTQKCKSVAFTFTDTPQSVNKPMGVNYQALSLELGIKRGVRKLPAVQST